jgi:hypothetical protein
LIRNAGARTIRLFGAPCLRQDRSPSSSQRERGVNKKAIREVGRFAGGVGGASWLPDSDGTHIQSRHHDARLKLSDDPKESDFNRYRKRSDELESGAKKTGKVGDLPGGDPTGFGSWIGTKIGERFFGKP